jgi:2'-5' RNA ligase
MRSFIAIKIEDEIIKQIRKLQNDLRTVLENKTGTPKKNAEKAVKWVEPQRMHLTLKFLGHIDDNKAVTAANVVEKVVQYHKSFDIHFRGTGFFGKPGRIFWAGIKPSKKLKDLQADIDQNLAKAGFPPEKREYKGHLTICRIKSNRLASALRKAAQDFEHVDFGPNFIESVGLYKSELTNTGPLYTLMNTSYLK